MSQRVLSDLQDTWPRQFLRVAEQLRAALPLRGAVVEHIGSTAVPGLCAKPVLDSLLLVSTPDKAASADAKAPFSRQQVAPAAEGWPGSIAPQAIPRHRSP